MGSDEGSRGLVETSRQPSSVMLRMTLSPMSGKRIRARRLALKLRLQPQRRDCLALLARIPRVDDLQIGREAQPGRDREIVKSLHAAFAASARSRARPVRRARVRSRHSGRSRRPSGRSRGLRADCCRRGRQACSIRRAWDLPSDCADEPEQPPADRRIRLALKEVLLDRVGAEPIAFLRDDRPARHGQRAYRADFVEINAARVAIGGAEGVEAGKTEESPSERSPKRPPRRPFRTDAR